MDRRSFVAGAAASAAALAARPALAEGFPSHAITIINAFPPGGANDIVTRPLASAMEPIFNQPVVVETKAGAAGAVGAQFVASAKPDGYTLLSHNTGISGFAEVDKLFGRPVKVTRADFIPLARIIADPCLLLVNDQQPYKTAKDYLDAIKSKPDNTFKMGGTGSKQEDQIVTVALEKAAGKKLTYIPYKGGAPSVGQVRPRVQASMVTGSSISGLNACSRRAPVAPSTTR